MSKIPPKWVELALRMKDEIPPPKMQTIADACGVTRQNVSEYFRRHGIKKPWTTKFVDEQRHCHACGQMFTWTRDQQSRWHQHRRTGQATGQTIVCSLKCNGKLKRKDTCWICKQQLQDSDPVTIFKERSDGGLPYAVHKVCWNDYRRRKWAELPEEEQERRIKRKKELDDARRRAEADRVHAERYGLTNLLDGDASEES